MKFQDDISIHTHTDKPKPICPPLFQSWGHNEVSRVLTRFSPSQVYWNFFKRSRAANSQSMVKPGQNSNSSKILWLPSLPEIMKKIRSKIGTRVLPRFPQLKPYVRPKKINALFPETSEYF